MDVHDADAFEGFGKVSVGVLGVVLLVVVVVAPLAVVAGVLIVVAALRYYEGWPQAGRLAVGVVVAAVGSSIIWFVWVPMIREHDYVRLPEVVDPTGHRKDVDMYRFDLRLADLTNVHFVQTNPEAWLCHVVKVSSDPPPDPSRHDKIPQSARITVWTDC